ncbi:MAG: efflux RND transporter periplasmic adaptor subunit [Acidobacteriota bacterium]|nr:efflux RND transporter periplasmic adaptor subunit [Acidobacteriota bacterium]MDH3527970.1 efflux RND transporter periplasmic adaptor subunit [Acidobacteriota bacterium]
MNNEEERPEVARSPDEERANGFEIDEPIKKPGGFIVGPRLVIAAASGILVICILAFGIWYMFFRGPGGKPVAAPRNTSFSETNGGKPVPENERMITLSDDQLKAANLKIVEVGESLVGTAAEATTTGVINANDYAMTPVVTQVSGVVKSINADLGRFVRRGDTIAVVSSEELASAQSVYLSRKAELDEANKRYARALSLSEISEESRNELDSMTAKLEAAEAMLSETKANYERSKKLASIGAISKRELEKAETAFKTAAAEREEASKRFERSKSLLKINPARRNEIDSYLTMVRKKQSEVGSERARLLVLGLSKRRIDSLNSPSQINADLPVASPVTGTITERIANRGEVVTSNGKLAKVTDLSTVWVIAQVFEKDLGRLRIGSGAGVTTDAYPGRYFRGNISYIDPELDTSTRTAQVRIELSNAGQELKIGMYVNVAFATIGGREKTTAMVPEAAVQFLGDEQVVFEATEDPKTFVIRRVSLMDKTGTNYPVKEGIFVGDKIVTEGSFLLRAEWLKTN